MVKERTQIDATARLGMRALVHREADGRCARGLSRPFNDRGVELLRVVVRLRESM